MYSFNAEVWSLDNTSKLTQVKAGDPVLLKIKPIVNDNSLNCPDTIRSLSVSLHSDNDLISSSDTGVLNYKNGFTKEFFDTITFSKSTESTYDIVNVSGTYTTANGDTTPIWGFSDPILVIDNSVKIKPGNRLSFTNNQLNSNVRFEFYDLRGRMVGAIQNGAIVKNNALQVNRNSAARGMYIVKEINTVTGKVQYYRDLKINQRTKKQQKFVKF